MPDNGFIESFNGRRRDELLTETLFNSLAGARVATALWRADYNTARPRSQISWTLAGKAGEDVVENTQPTPPDEAAVERLVRAVAGWRVLPLQSVADHVDDAAHHPPVINPGNPRATAESTAISAPSGARSAETNHPSRNPSQDRESHLRPN